MISSRPRLWLVRWRTPEGLGPGDGVSIPGRATDRTTSWRLVPQTLPACDLAGCLADRIRAARCSGKHRQASTTPSLHGTSPVLQTTAFACTVNSVRCISGRSMECPRPAEVSCRLRPRAAHKPPCWRREASCTFETARCEQVLDMSPLERSAEHSLHSRRQPETRAEGQLHWTGRPSGL